MRMSCNDAANRSWLVNVLRWSSGSSEVPPMATRARVGTSSGAIPAAATTGGTTPCSGSNVSDATHEVGAIEVWKNVFGDRSATSTAPIALATTGRDPASRCARRSPRGRRRVHGPASSPHNAHTPGPDGRRAPRRRDRWPLPMTAPPGHRGAQLARSRAGAHGARGMGASRRYMTSGPSGARGAPPAPARSATHSANATMIDATPGA